MARVPLKKRWSPPPAVRRGRRVCWAVLLVLLAIGALSFFRRCKGGVGGITAIVRDSNSSVSSGTGGVAPATAFDPASTINLEALDGTGGRQGPRTWGGNEPSRDNAFVDPKDYLEPEDYVQYQQWLAWSDKPRGMDYVRPSRTHFSLGKTRAWKGDIARPGSMKEMLEARSYKKEIIHACIAGGDTWRIGLNFIFNMRDLGYDHWVIYVPREQQCSELEAALRGVGTIGCMWTTMFDGEDAPQPLRLHPDHLPNKHVTWVVRWVHLLRAVRLGYNFFNIDTDIVLHDDIYKYLKGPLLGNLTWICGDEDSRDACNGGTNYVQNASPNGAAAWMAGTMVDRMLRIAEDVGYWRNNPYSKNLRDWSAAVDDQAQLNSAMRSATIGYYVLPHVFPGMDDGELWKAIVENPWEEHNMDRAMDMPELWRQRFRTDKVGIKWHKLAVPTQQLTPIFNNSRGAFAAKFWAGVAGESGPVTWHDVTLESAPQNPELVDMSAGAAAAVRPDPWAGFKAEGSGAGGDAPAEYLGKTLDFFINNWHSGFKCGSWWGVKPPRSVVAHTVLIHAGFARVMFFKLAGWFHWKVEQLMMEHMGAPGFYPVSTREEAHPRLLLIAPSANLNNMTSAGLADIGFDLLTTAAVAGRKLVWPLIGCGTQWLVHSEDAGDQQPGAETRGCQVPRGCRCGVHDHWFGTPWHWMPVIPLVDENYPAERKYCIHWREYNDCFHDTLMYPDFKHMLRHFSPAAATPTPDNTMSHDALADSGEIGVEGMTAEALEQRLQGFAEQPVLYLGKVPRVDSGAVAEDRRQGLGELQRRCRPVWRLKEERMQERLAPLMGG